MLKGVHYRLGVKTRAFHLGDYRRAHMGPGTDVPHDYFFIDGEAPHAESLIVFFMPIR